MELDLVFVETGSGVVSYYCFTSDVDRAMDRIEAAQKLGVGLEFRTSLDPEWLEYYSRARRLR